MRMFVLVAVMFTLFGCSTLSPSVYTTDEAMQPSATLIGIVEHVRQVTTESSGDGAAAYGAALGAVALGRIGVGTGHLVSALAGAGVGAGTGEMLANASTRTNADEIVVLIPTNTGNRLITVVQGTQVTVKPGDWVYVIATRTNSFVSGTRTQFRVIPAGKTSLKSVG